MKVEWVSLSGENIADIADLAQRCMRRDSGLRATASRAFLERRYAGSTVKAVGAFKGGHLLACGAVRPLTGSSVVVGLVDPAHRGRGLGSELFDRLLDVAKERSERLQVETESLTQEAHEIFRSRGFDRVFAEDIYRCDLTDPLPQVPLLRDVEVEEWKESNQGAFYDAYRASFEDRPGFPGWSQAQWVDWLVDETFLPQCSLVAKTGNGIPIGFVTCAQEFLVQVGTVPEWRQRGLGRGLAIAALERMRVSGSTEVFLDINVNNPASAALFQGLGFSVIARRARYEQR
ncbi:GNAT family N-acetyltransferase [Streptomyces sp. CB02009]|uniref:GNAT family N-acetyltransferase n=1 Tax=Streptomyces sp. CB02009 TaxID=1703938 RepID=UPI00093EF528|nr:GNAT family N-acetyltransferase [Streptomyces sp. CB02009]